MATHLQGRHIQVVYEYDAFSTECRAEDALATLVQSCIHNILGLKAAGGNEWWSQPRHLKATAAAEWPQSSTILPPNRHVPSQISARCGSSIQTQRAHVSGRTWLQLVCAEKAVRMLMYGPVRSN